LIPPSLTEPHKQKRVKISIEPLQFLEKSSAQNLAPVFTGDENWFYLDNSGNSMWLASGAPDQQGPEGISELGKL
jgi:hypothetical protein